MSTAAELRAESRRLARLAREAELEEARQRVLEREARKPAEPGINAVITFSKVQSGRTYNYAALSFPVGGTQRRWAITNTVTGGEGRYTWSGLLDFIGEANWTSIHQATAFTPVTPIEPPVVERMGPFGRVTSTENVEDYHGKASGPSFPFGHE